MEHKLPSGFSGICVNQYIVHSVLYTIVCLFLFLFFFVFCCLVCFVLFFICFVFWPLYFVFLRFTVSDYPL